MHNLAVTYVRPSELRPYPGNARTHSKRQVKLIARSITEFGWTTPMLVSDDNEVIAGHGRLEAAKLVKLEKSPFSDCRTSRPHNDGPTSSQTTRLH
jgi:ParB-like chromosome segregation protein Spo0J